ncbi:hypothetical protein BH10ACT9_BH10ACT9_58120 [soil metagenome]
MSTHTTSPVLLTVTETAERARLSKRHIENEIKAGALPVIRIGTRVLVDAADLAEFLNARRTRGKAAMHIDTAVIGNEVAAATRCQMNGDHEGVARVIDGSKYSRHLHLAGVLGVLARMAAQADNPEQFLAVVADIVARD